MTHSNSFESFTQLALRTESKVSDANINIASLSDLLELFILTGTLLDYAKKGIFYNNYSKYDENYKILTTQLAETLQSFQQRSSSLPKGQVNHLNFRILHGLLGTATEASEIAELLLDYIKTGEIDEVGISEEFSDIDWYKAVTFDELSLDENTCRQNVINKLKVRFPDKYSDSAAADRNLDAERKMLEQNLTKT